MNFLLTLENKTTIRYIKKHKSFFVHINLVIVSSLLLCTLFTIENKFRSSK